MTRRPGMAGAMTAAGAAMLALALGSLFLGAGAIPPGRVLAVLSGGGDPVDASIVLDLRLARALLAALCGGSLAAAGVVVQGLFRNPLADPFVLGISGGAALGAVIALAVGISWTFGVAGAAFAGGLAAAFGAYRLSRIDGRHPVATLLLAGFVIGTFCSAILAIVLLAGRNTSGEDVLRWLFGSCAHHDAWRRVAVGSPLVIAALAVIVPRLRELNVMSTGDESAQHLGVDVERAKGWLLLAAAILTAGAVAMCGIIGFVGLIVPHIARRLMGPDHRRLLPVAVIGGAAMLMAADLAARTALSPYELPVGAITALLGGPFFLWLLRRSA